MFEHSLEEINLLVSAATKRRQQWQEFLAGIHGAKISKGSSRSAMDVLDALPAEPGKDAVMQLGF